MKLIQNLIEYIAPLECLNCGLEGAIVCQNCLNYVVITKRPTCYRCNRLTPDGRTCASCRSSSSLAGVTVASHYDGAIKELIGALKYQRASSAARLAAAILLPHLFGQQFDLITCVPTSGARYRTRGYNQAKLIATSLATGAHVPYSDLLARLDDVHQIGTGRQQRLTQLQGIFEAKKVKSIQGARILLVDDVVTTGATMAECAKVLKAAGAKRVWGAAVAKH